jgi:hypothetical protein
LASIPDTSTKVVAAAYFTTSATSFVTTVLIAYRIYSTAKHEGVSGRRFKHIIDIIVQSGAVYSLSLLQLAIAFVLPGSMNILNTRSYAFNIYGSTLVNITAVCVAFTYNASFINRMINTGNFDNSLGRSCGHAGDRYSRSLNFSSFIWTPVPRVFYPPDGSSRNRPLTH